MRERTRETSLKMNFDIGWRDRTMVPLYDIYFAMEYLHLSVKLEGVYTNVG